MEGLVLSIWYVYILECVDGTLYTGIAKDVASRVKQHNHGKGAKYTRGRIPVQLVYQEAVECHGDALRREMQIKRKGLLYKQGLIREAGL
ncbi:MAG: GIY-YIG nuclease family protein [Gammaproteobacteria bacterium]|nr:GIY-YIG nuclease family protein [Gammaproteobacteria bacterium]